MRTIFIVWSLLLLAGLASVQLGFASVGVQYAAMTAVQLVVVVVATVGVATGVCFLVLSLIDRFAGGMIARSALLHVAWHLLRSQRSVPTFKSRIHQAKKRLSEAPPFKEISIASAIIFILSSGAYLAPPWAPWVVPSRQVFLWSGLLALAFGAFRLVLAKLLTLKERPPVALEVRQKRGLTLPTFIAVVGIAVGVWALIVVLSVMRGFGEDLRKKILQVDAHVHAESSVLDTPITGFDALLESLKDLPEIAQVHPMVVGRVILTTPFNVSASVDIKGIDPATYGQNQGLSGVVGSKTFESLMHPERLLSDMRVRERIREHLSTLDEEQGLKKSWNEDDETEDSFTPPSKLFPGIILGSELASSLQVQVGDKVQVISPDGDETPFGIRPRTRSFRVANIFHSGMYQYDLRLAYIASWEAQNLFQVRGGPNRVEMVAHNPENSGIIVNQIRDLVDNDEVEIRDWKTMNQALLSALAVERIAMFLVLGFIVLVASFNIVGSLILIIMEKGREIAILRAMGGSSRWMGRTFLAVGAFIGVVGIGTGLGLGLLSCAVVALIGLPLPREYYVETVPVDVDPVLVVAVVVVTAAVTLAATLYPTRQAARIVPSEGLRYE